MPGIHDGRIGAQTAGFASVEGDDVKLTVGAHELPVMALDEDDPFAVGRHLGKVVAHTVLRGAGNGLGSASLTVVEGDPVKIVLNLSLVGIVGVEGGFLAILARVARHRTREHDGLAVGAPNAIRLHKMRVVGAGQRLAQSRGAAVPLQDAAGWIKDLQKAVVLEIGDVIRFGYVEGWAGKGADDKAAVRRHLGHEAYTRRADLSVGVPLHHVVVLNRNVALDGSNGIEALVVGGTVYVDAHGLAVHGEGMAIGAGGHVVENGMAFCLANIAKAPFD